MTKVTGFVLLQLSALMFLHRRLLAEKRKAESAASFRDMLEQLLGFLERESSPMPELLQLLQNRVHGVSALFTATLQDSMDMLGEHSFRELWRRALYSHSEDMDQELLRILEEPGAVLGHFELARQLDAVGLCLHELRRYCEKQRREQPQKARLAIGLTLSVSLMAGILLL